MKILIVGSGIAGLSLFHKLKHSQHEVDLMNKKTKSTPNLVQIYHRKTPSLGETTG